MLGVKNILIGSENEGQGYRPEVRYFDNDILANDNFSYIYSKITQRPKPLKCVTHQSMFPDINLDMTL